MESGFNKAFRLLSMYERLNKGEILTKDNLSLEFGVTRKTVQRDIDDLRAYLSDMHVHENEIKIKYNRVRGGYYIVKFERDWLTNREVLGLCKILLESRAFCKEELDGFIQKLMSQVLPTEKKKVEALIKSELMHYVPLKHGKKLLDCIWELSLYITGNEIIKLKYKRQDKTLREHTVKPVAIMFSEYYFYLVAYLADDSKETPTIFRIDRINGINGTNENFRIPYAKQFSEGEFRKRVQFMYPGELKQVTFEFTGHSLEAVLDRLPTARVISKGEGSWIISAEVFGDGILMWLRSQGDWVKILS